MQWLKLNLNSTREKNKLTESQRLTSKDEVFSIPAKRELEQNGIKTLLNEGELLLNEGKLLQTQQIFNWRPTNCDSFLLKVCIFSISVCGKYEQNMLHFTVRTRSRQNSVMYVQTRSCFPMSVVLVNKVDFLTHARSLKELTVRNYI